MEKIEVNTLDELKKARKDKAEEIVVNGDLINVVKKATTLKKMFYWIILLFLLLAFNFVIESKIIDFYALFNLNAMGLSRSISSVIVLIIALVIIIFGLMSSKVCNYKFSYVDQLYKNKESISLFKVWYF